MGLTPVQQASSVESTKEQLSLLAEKYPAQVLKNPVTDLLLWEDPCWQAPRIARRLLAIRLLRRRGVEKALPDWAQQDGSGSGYGDGSGSGSQTKGGAQ